MTAPFGDLPGALFEENNRISAMKGQEELV
jgi:hypothetical protein